MKTTRGFTITAVTKERDGDEDQIDNLIAAVEAVGGVDPAVSVGGGETSATAYFADWLAGIADIEWALAKLGRPVLSIHAAETQ